MVTHYCRKCERDLPADAFFKSSRNRSGVQSQCKACFKSWRWAKVGPPQPRVSGIPRRLAQRGLTPDDLKALRATQGDKCAICGEVEIDRDLAIDHCHETGEVRGLLCGRCNLALGLLRDDTERLRAAISYLATPPSRGVLPAASCNASGRIR